MSGRYQEPELAHCARCRRLFVRMQSNVCENCRTVEEVDFARIREELERTPELTADELAERAGVPVACVFRMLDEGMLARTKSDDNKCGRCGAPAIGPKQRLCMACMLDLDRKITRQLNEAQLLKRSQTMRGKAQGLWAMIRARRRET